MKKTLLAVCLLAGFGNAHALLNTSGGSDGTGGVIPQGADTNEFLNALEDAMIISDAIAFGCYGCDITASQDADLYLTFDFFGSEAGFDNLFNFDGSEIFNTGGGTSPGGAFNTPLLTPLESWSTQIWVDAGDVIPFSFTSEGFGDVLNGSNPLNDPDLVNFFVTALDCLAVSDFGGACGVEDFFGTNSLWLFLDDAGNDDDDNHDDMIIRISAREVVKVPEAGTLGLLGMGLAMMGFVARRRA